MESTTVALGMLCVMPRGLQRELVWLAGSILVVGLTLAAFAIANDASASLDVFAGFLAVVGGAAVYVVVALLRLTAGLGPERATGYRLWASVALVMFVLFCLWFYFAIWPDLQGEQ